MEHTPITGVLLDASRNTICKAVLDGTLDGYYNALECRCFDIVCRNISGRYFDIYCDDEGLFVEEPKVTAFSPDGEPMLVGNLFICLHDDEGNTVSLADEDIDRILRATRGVITQHGIRRVLVMDY